MKVFPPEMIAKAKAAKSAEELIEIANANNIELTDKEANTYFDQLNTNGAVSDDELDVIAGGACGESEETDTNEEAVTYNEGDIVKFFDGTPCSCGCSPCIIGRAPHLRYGAYLRCTTCQTIVFDHIPYDRVYKL